MRALAFLRSLRMGCGLRPSIAARVTRGQRRKAVAGVVGAETGQVSKDGRVVWVQSPTAGRLSCSRAQTSLRTCLVNHLVRVHALPAT